MNDKLFHWMDKYFFKLFAGFVALFVIGIVGLIGGRVFVAASGREHEVAQREADAFVRDMGIRGKARCADMDTEGDGYVSCTLVTDDGRIEALECAGAFTINNGCRAPKAIVGNR